MLRKRVSVLVSEDVLIFLSQIVFNEALSKVVAEKDRIIEDLKGKEALLTQQREDDQRK